MTALKSSTPTVGHEHLYIDALSFGIFVGGRIREVFLCRSILKRWAAVDDDRYGLLRVYDQNQAAILKAVRRRAAKLGDAVTERVQLSDFADSCDAANDAELPSAIHLSPIYCQLRS
jgi:hypothetical protein